MYIQNMHVRTYYFSDFLKTSSSFQVTTCSSISYYILRETFDNGIIGSSIH